MKIAEFSPVFQPSGYREKQGHLECFELLKMQFPRATTILKVRKTWSQLNFRSVQGFKQFK